VASSTLGDASVENCIAQAVRRWRFPQPGGGGIVIVTYPFQLTAPEGDWQGAAAEPEPEPEPPKPEIAVQAAAVCSDASSRPLHERRVVWQRRVLGASGAESLAAVFFEAKRRCELKGWRDSRVLLNLIEERVTSASDVTALLAELDGHPTQREYLRKRILRRAFDPEMVFSLYRAGGIDWNTVSQGLAALKTVDAKIAEIEKLLENRPADPVGRTILASTLFEAGRNEQALATALRLKRDGLTTPAVLKILCDLQAAAGRDWEARRSCSELVEFNENDASARMRLGNLFLRHGWFDAAYRQFRTLADMTEETPLALLKLARAAAGMGRIDEALRMERKVAAGEGEPGPGDIRQWAKLHSVVLIASMMLEAQAKNDKSKLRALERALKRTQALAERAVLKIVVWEDEDANLAVTAKQGEEVLPVSRRVAASPVGLQMIDLGPEAPPNAEFKVILEGGPLVRSVPYTLYTVSFDGKDYTVEKSEGELPAKRRG
jgi:Ca-activated chloride channel family protein